MNIETPGDPISAYVPGECNICGSTELLQQRKQAICTSCRSDARTRLLWLLLTSRDLLQPGMRVLHFAPERSIAGRLRMLVGDGYEPVDADPSSFSDVAGMRKLDLVAEAAALPPDRYDLVIHSHVMEHVRCNVTAVLFHLHRALAAGGKQVCSIPISRNDHYAEDLSPLVEDEAIVRFGQQDHVRRFGSLDIQLTLGMIFRLPKPTIFMPSSIPHCLTATASIRPCEPAGRQAASWCWRRRTCSCDNAMGG